MNQTAQKSDRRLKSAFTLIEIMLVLALLVVLTAISWPLMHGSLSSQRLRSAAEQVRTAWANARSQAMTSGQIHMFRYQPESRSYQVQAWGGFDAAVEGEQTDDFQENDSLESVEEASGEKLPETIVFLSAIQQTDTRALATSGLETSVSLGGAASSRASSGRASSGGAPPVLFYPDGTTSTVELQLANDQAQFVAISLRGLTGIVTVGKIFSGEESR